MGISVCGNSEGCGRSWQGRPLGREQGETNGRGPRGRSRGCVTHCEVKEEWSRAAAKVGEAAKWMWCLYEAIGTGAVIMK